MKGFNITTQDLLDERKRIDENAKLKIKEYALSANEQKFLEDKYLATYQYCPGNIDPKEIVKRLHSLNANNVKSELRERFYNQELFKAMSCITSSAYYYESETSLSQRERIHEIYSKLRQIGAESAVGYALSGGLKDITNDVFVLKAPRNPIDKDELKHECSVAFYGTNQLRPHFAYVYGMIVCAPPFIDSSTKDVMAWCETNKSAVAYAVYENISPAVSFQDYCKKCSAYDFMMYYLQVLMALKLAVNTCGFTHYDLHNENVLLRKVSEEPFYLPYKWGTDKIYLKSNGYVSTIIDYGMSHIQLRDNQTGEIRHFGKAGETSWEAVGIYRDRANPICDVYKLLGFSMNTFLSSNKAVFTTLAPLLRYFNKTEAPEIIIANQDTRSTYYAFPDMPNFSLDDYIQFCADFAAQLGYTDIVATKPAGPVMSCEEGMCKKFYEEMSYVGINLNEKVSIPMTFLEFYDVIGTLSENNEVEDKQRIIEGFPQYYESAYIKEEQRLSQLRPSLQEFTVYQLPALELLYNESVLKQMKDYFAKCVKFFDAYNRLATGLRVGKAILTMYNINVEDSFYAKLEQDLSQYRPFYIRLEQILEADKQRLYTMVNPMDLRTVPDMYKWYWTTYAIIDSLFTF